jgi:hypothetical protein
VNRETSLLNTQLVLSSILERCLACEAVVNRETSLLNTVARAVLYPGALPRLRGRGEQGNIVTEYPSSCCPLSSGD